MEFWGFLFHYHKKLLLGFLIKNIPSWKILLSFLVTLVPFSILVATCPAFSISKLSTSIISLFNLISTLSAIFILLSFFSPRKFFIINSFLFLSTSTVIGK